MSCEPEDITRVHNSGWNLDRTPSERITYTNRLHFRWSLFSMGVTVLHVKDVCTSLPLVESQQNWCVFMSVGAKVDQGHLLRDPSENWMSSPDLFSLRRLGGVSPVPTTEIACRVHPFIISIGSCYALKPQQLGSRLTILGVAPIILWQQQLFTYNGCLGIFLLR